MEIHSGSLLTAPEWYLVGDLYSTIISEKTGGVLREIWQFWKGNSMTQSSYHVGVLRSAVALERGVDCTMGGASSRFSQAILYRYSIPDDHPSGVAAFLLETSPRVGIKPYPRAIPPYETRHVMFGGNFIWSSDSRFRQEVSEGPIPVHDRVER
jgi:hypothetical protein